MAGKPPGAAPGYGHGGREASGGNRPGRAAGFPDIRAKEVVSRPAQRKATGSRIPRASLVDTGASFCIFQRVHAETIGIAVDSGEPMRISTVTGGFDAYAHRVALGVLGIEVEATVCFAEDYAMPRDVLGRTGWLDRVRLGLVDHDRQFFLSHYDDAAHGQADPE